MPDLNLYVSTASLSGRDRAAGLEEYDRAGLAVEFSANMPPGLATLRQFEQYAGRKLAHNYFPAPADPFVINLGSFDADIRRRSIEHCKLGLRTTARCEAPFFAAHAGFMIDPDPRELGKPLSLPAVLPEREACNALFLDAVAEVLEEAAALDTVFLIENNVIAGFNLLPDGGNPLLGCTAADLCDWVNHFNNDRFGILLDTAHLKVSARTLGLDLDEQARAVLPCVKAIHHSDNDGLVDNNQPLGNDYWFLPYAPGTRTLPQVLEVRAQSLDQVLTQYALLNSASTQNQP